MRRISDEGCAFAHSEFSQRRGGRGERGDREGRGDRGAWESPLKSFYDQVPDGQFLFVGSVNCLRHKPYLNIGQLMQEGKASVLSPSMTDFSTGRYLRQIIDAIVELSQERNCRRFMLSFGCQWVILSTDEDIVRQELKEEHGIEVTFFDDSHLEHGDHQ